jgi:hypothetical protein
VGKEGDRAVSAKKEGAMNLRIVAYCVLGGLAFSIAAMGAGHFGWWWLSGVLMAAAYVPLVRFGPRSWVVQFGMIFVSMFVVAGVCTASEAAMFLPGQSVAAWRNLQGAFGMYLIAAAWLTVLAKVLKLTEDSGASPDHRSGMQAVAGVLASGFAYVMLYLVFGSIAFFMFTKQYYPQGEQMARSFGIWLWVIQLGRGILMTVAVLPMIYTLRMQRWPAALAIGILLWVVGGLALLVVPMGMVPMQRFAHIVEIFTQNFSLGVAAVLLLRPKRAEVLAVSVG